VQYDEHRQRVSVHRGEETLLLMTHDQKEKFEMKTKLRGKIKQFLTSEEGRVGLKTPLVLGIASGSVLLAQALLPPSAHSYDSGRNECDSDFDCNLWESCERVCRGTMQGTECDGEWVRECV